MQIVTGEIPNRGMMRNPKVPDECPQVGRGGAGRAPPRGGGQEPEPWAAFLPPAADAASTLWHLPCCPCCPRSPAGLPACFLFLPPPQEVLDLIDQCTALSPSERPSAKQIVQMLEGAPAGTPSKAEVRWAGPKVICRLLLALPLPNARLALATRLLQSRGALLRQQTLQPWRDKLPQQVGGGLGGGGSCAPAQRHALGRQKPLARLVAPLLLCHPSPAD